MARRLEELPSQSNINLDSRLFNSVFLQLLYVVYNYLVLYGGSGSGKSTFLGQMFAVQMTIFAGRNLVCLRVQKTDCIKSCWAEIYNALKKFKLLRYWEIRKNPDHIMINRLNGNQIIFEGVDSIEDIKSIKFTKEQEDMPGDDNLTDAWYEEVNSEKDIEVIRELDRRLRDPYIKGRLVLSFNPVLRTHWLFDYVMNELKMTGVDSFVLKTTYKDNRFLPAEYGPKLERLKYTDPYAYQVYALGNWGTMGQTIFDANKVFARLTYLEKKYELEPYSIGDFIFEKDIRGKIIDSTVEFSMSQDGSTYLFKTVENRHPYVLAVDTAGEGSDFYTGQVCDNLDGNQVAVFHNDGNPDWCIEQTYCIAVYYNHALYCPETNFERSAITFFTTNDYPNLYRRQSPGDKTHVRSEDRYGFRTGPDTRPDMLITMIKETKEHMDFINDPMTLNEMLTFTRQEKKLKGIWWGAESGANDDLVIAYAIMLQARSQQSMEMVTDVLALKGHWTREELEDAVYEGEIDQFTMQEYIQTHDLYMENKEVSGVRQRGRVSRYAR